MLTKLSINQGVRKHAFFMRQCKRSSANASDIMHPSARPTGTRPGVASEHGLLIAH
ncbi:hypothetical protein ABQY74_010360 [Xanthomonas sp. WHRI 7064]|uniref:hypothetical protein n=1 Tax=Xanthomonas sp. WHRI 7064 TaxID=3161568 RepID=UPI0032E852C6